MWTDSLKQAEVELTSRAINALQHIAWAAPLLNRLDKAGGITTQNRPLLFEIRVAYEIHRACRTATYEFTSACDGSVDFRVHGSPEWLIEIVSIGESDAVKEATVKNDPISQVLLKSISGDNKSSEEGELILLQQKIGEKVFNAGKPVKFPTPEYKIHLILADVRGFNIGASDRYDYDHAAQGAGVLPDPIYVRFWANEPIKGLFERSNPLRASKFIQERIHFLGFVKEKNYSEGEITRRTYLSPNPHLFADRNEIARVYDTFPLKAPVSVSP